MIFGECTRVMGLHFLIKRPAVGKIGSKEKELEGGKNCRQNPKDDQFYFSEPNKKNIEDNCHKQNLPPGDVIFHESKPPNKKVVATG